VYELESESAAIPPLVAPDEDLSIASGAFAPPVAGPVSGPEPSVRAADTGDAVYRFPGQAEAFADPNDGMGDLVVLRHDEGVRVITIDTPSLRDPGAGHIASRLVGMAREETVRLAVSLGLVQELTSSGICSLVSASEQIDRIGGRLVLFAMPDAAAKVLKQTGLSRRLLIANEAHDAVKLARRERGWVSRLRRAG
jgi:anti-anti-sigma regulatory factor